MTSKCFQISQTDPFPLHCLTFCHAYLQSSDEFKSKKSPTINKLINSHCKTFNYLRIRLEEPEQDENKIQGWTISTQNNLEA